ncbi:MAG: hypothetical protein ACXACA_00905 [Candidatus Ranarchaeia archaeon]|jgi:hypothetical protein
MYSEQYLPSLNLIPNIADTHIRGDNLFLYILVGATLVLLILYLIKYTLATQPHRTSHPWRTMRVLWLALALLPIFIAVLQGYLYFVDFHAWMGMAPWELPPSDWWPVIMIEILIALGFFISAIVFFYANKIKTPLTRY